MRIFGKALCRAGDANLLQEMNGTRLGFLAPHLLMQGHRFGNLKAHGMHRRKRRKRLLKDHRDLIATDAADGVAVRVQAGHIHHLTVALAKQNFSINNLARALGQQAQNRMGCDTFATPRFTDNAQRAAWLNLERNTINGAYSAV